MRSAPSSPTPSRKPVRIPWNEVASALDASWKIAVLALLAWIAWNVNVIRKATITKAPPAAVSTTTDVAPTYEPDLSSARIRRIATALKARPPRGIRVADTVTNDIAAGALARVAVEIFLRRNGCHETSEAVDGRFSAAEQRAIRNCAVLQDERLMKDRTEPDPARAIAWLEESLVP